MVLTRTILAASALLSVALAHAPAMGKRAPMNAIGIEKNKDGFGSEAIAIDEVQAAFAPPSQLGKKNATMPQLKDRSLELVDRQSCDAGYWYCSGFGRCCPRSSNCCNYGYCIDPAATCCPSGPCDPGWNCCGSNCSPKGGDCCSDGNYCEPGNMCVKLGSNGRIVCCTDVQCTAAVVSGSTSRMTTATQAANNPSITSPPMTTAVVSVGQTYETWYWTVTWWYLSFYYTTLQAKSSVTYTTLYETTTYTTTATDESEASSLFSALSKTLTFTPPASAHTDLATLLNVQPSQTEAASFGFGAFTTGIGGPAQTGKSSTTTAKVTAGPAGNGNPNTPPAGASLGSGLVVRWGLIGMGVVSGVLMVWL